MSRGHSKQNAKKQEGAVKDNGLGILFVMTLSWRNDKHN